MNLSWNTELKNIFRNEKPIFVDFGVSCLFICLTNKIGIKIYNNKYERNFAFREQKRAYHLGFGPMTGSVFVLRSLVDIDIIKSQEDNHPSCWIQIKNKYYAYLTQVVNLTKELSNKEVSNLHKIMRKNNYATGDVSSSHNTGFINGKPVCYDFDPLTLSC